MIFRNPRLTGSTVSALFAALIATILTAAPRTARAVDCNNNGIDDATEIAGNPALDCNSNGVLDSCETSSTLYGNDSKGKFFSININNGLGTAVGPFGTAGSEIEISPTGTGYVQSTGTLLSSFNPLTGIINPGPIDDAHNFNAFEYVAGTLYGTSDDGPNLWTLNPSSGAATLIGPVQNETYFNTGLAYDFATSRMFAIDTGDPATTFTSTLYTINLATGFASPIADTGIYAGSLQFGPDGQLYAGTVTANPPDQAPIPGGFIYTIDKQTAYRPPRYPQGEKESAKRKQSAEPHRGKPVFFQSANSCSERCLPPHANKAIRKQDPQFSP